jgi:hypothetical protein
MSKAIFYPPINAAYEREVIKAYDQALSVVISSLPPAKSEKFKN